MIRTAAQVAKILNADSQQLKQWAFEFKDYLSASANPSKGNSRHFRDTDVLVLSYIQHYWEDDPDVECIQIGLNRGEQYEDVFLEHLYMHTPLDHHYEQWFDFQHFKFAMKLVFDTIENAICRSNSKGESGKKK
jgi:hypothetical protein